MGAELLLALGLPLLLLTGLTLWLANRRHRLPAWLAWLKAGGPLQVQIDETQKTYPARFTRIGARVDPVSQSVKVAAAIDGRFPELIAGMSGRVIVPNATNN